MSDIVIGVRQLMQDMLAPELKSHSAKSDALQMQYDHLQKQVEIQLDALMKTLDAVRAEMRSDFAALRATNQMEVFSPGLAHQRAHCRGGIPRQGGLKRLLSL